MIMCIEFALFSAQGCCQVSQFGSHSTFSITLAYYRFQEKVLGMTGCRVNLEHICVAKLPATGH